LPTCQPASSQCSPSVAQLICAALRVVAVAVAAE
jgi:hypothetical protein